VTVIGVDDTDSRTRGMCTTYVGDTIARRLEASGAAVYRVLLIRCNPAIEHKTRGNAAVAIHTDAPPESAFDTAGSVIDELAETADERTNPGLVVGAEGPETVPEPIAAFARDAVRDHHTEAAARALSGEAGYRTRGWGNGRGIIGALAAVGAWRALEEWTYERISYRAPERWGTERLVDFDSVFEAADTFYPAVWDTVDRGSGEAVCVPRTPGPVLFGIRGDDPSACRQVTNRIESEPIDRARLFVTNQGTDGHLRPGTVEGVRDGFAYRLDGVVASSPETRRGGHVFFDLGDGAETIECAAFEPTKRFRKRVRNLRGRDQITACGEVTDGTLKLEKFAVRDLVRTTRETPVCPGCDRTMESAGRGQGYRCRDCGTTAGGKIEQSIDRELECGWYEVPPRARRHIAKPLVRGGFDAETHPER
jgi:tRNA(Ile2)-agmatinylcytidine synthase